MENTYTKQEVIDFVEKLWMYKFDYETKTWNMQTHLAPGALHETTEQLIDRFIDSDKRWKEHIAKLQTS